MSKGKTSGGKGSRKHGRNKRVNGVTGSVSRYVASGGPARAARRKARRIAHQEALKARGRAASTA